MNLDWQRHILLHRRFYLAALLGLVCYLAVPGSAEIRSLAAGDLFFLAYMLMMGALAVSLESEGLRARAWSEDEGMAVIFVIVFIAIGFSTSAVFSLLNLKKALGPVSMALAAAAVPLGWFTLHTMAAFHYAGLYYDRPAGTPPPLQFPGQAAPGTWDFLYFSFVIGMTAQVSDVQVMTARLRRATLGHGIVSFFFNTAILAMAVNAAVTLSS